MRIGVVPDGVALGQYLAGQRRMGRGAAAQHEEGCLDAFMAQRRQHRIGGAGEGAVIEGQRDLLGLQRQRRLEMLAADRGRGGRIDGQDTRGAERRRIAGTIGSTGGGGYQDQQRRAERRQLERSGHDHPSAAQMNRGPTRRQGERSRNRIVAIASVVTASYKPAYSPFTAFGPA